MARAEIRYATMG